MVKEDEFNSFHPIVNFVYFLFVISFSALFLHPLLLAASLICGIVYSTFLYGKKTVWFCLAFLLPVFILTAVINPLFNHEGANIIGYLPSGNPLTKESVYYGLSSGCMLAAVIIWFRNLSVILSSDKFIYLFGKVLPSLSLVLSMTLQFIPRFNREIKETAAAQKCLMIKSKYRLFGKIKFGIKVLSVMITKSLENSVQTADSMKSRGYGLKGRTAFSVYTFKKRDLHLLLLIIILGIFVAVYGVLGGFYFRYFPFVKSAPLNEFCLIAIAIYFVLLLTPMLLVIKERGGLWKY